MPHIREPESECCGTIDSDQKKALACDKDKSPLFEIPVYKGCRLVHMDNIEALLATLELNSALAERIFYFDFHFGYGDELVALCQQKMFQVMSTYGLNLRSLRIKFNAEIDPSDFEGCRPLENRSQLYVSDLSELETIPQRRVESISFNLGRLDQPQMNRLDLFSEHFAYVYQVPSLEFATVKGFGLDVIRCLQCGPVKLEPTQLTLGHRHQAEDDESDSITNSIDSIAPAKLDGEWHRLDFRVLEDKILLSRLTSLNLRVSCDEHNAEVMEDGCSCFVDFLADWRSYLSANSGLPNLQELELSVPPAREWARPHDFLNAIIIPASDFIKTLTGLRKLSFGLNTQSYKMYEQTGMSPDLLNRVNTRLIEAFFLSLGGAMSTLEHLELPDFLMAFFFYKPQFMELLLHTCQCSGCSMVLQELDVDLIPVDEEAEEDVEGSESHLNNNEDVNEYGRNENELNLNENELIDIERIEVENENENENEDEEREVQDQNEAEIEHQDEDEDDYDEIDPDADFDLLALGAFYVMIGIVLEKLLSTRTVLAPLNRKAGLSECAIYRGPPNVLKRIHLLFGKTNSLDLDALACTYILHQLRPALRFLAKHFPKLSLVMVHGLYYEKKEGEFHNIFDSDDYPELLYQRGHIASAEKYGHYVFE